MKNTNRNSLGKQKLISLAVNQALRAKRFCSPVRPVLTSLATTMLTFSSVSLAQEISPGQLPGGGQLVAGQTSISQAGAAMTVNQSSERAILNWTDFNIGTEASVHFNQPGESAIALNRVVGGDSSSIYGSLTANGQVFLINPNGVVFGAGSHVDVAGLVSSTLNLSDENFLAGNLNFQREGTTAGVVNNGDIQAGYVALLAPTVLNTGVIVTEQGTSVLAAGDAVTLKLAGSEMLSVAVEKASIDTLVENRHLIQAQDGKVIMTAQSAYEMLGKTVNTGTIAATGILSEGGVIRLVASSTIEQSGMVNADAGNTGNGGDVRLIADLENPNSFTTISGSISARGGNFSGDGGFIETSATRLNIADSTQIDTGALNGRQGNWLLDPYDFTIAAVNGDMTGSTLSAALASNNVTIQTTDSSVSCSDTTCGTGDSSGNGDIFVNDAVTWGSGNTLTLSAWRDVYINAPMDATDNGGGPGTGTGKLVLELAQSDYFSNFPFGIYSVSAPVTLASGQNFSVYTGRTDGVGLDAPWVDDYTVITDKAGLSSMTTGDNTVRYALGSDIDATGGWTPIGSIGFGSTFDGYFEGFGHTISNISISNTANEQYVGLFGATSNASNIQNVGLINANVAGLAHVGALVGSNGGGILNVYSTGTVTGSDIDGTTFDDDVYAIGGLVGSNSGPMGNVFSTATVSATTGSQGTGGMTNGGIGGLVGFNDGSIGNTYATGNVTGIGSVGGLVGTTLGSVGSSYASGSVTGSGNVGSVIGELFNPFTQPLLFDTYWISDDVGSSSAADGFNSSSRISVANSTAKSSWTNFDFDGGQTWLIREGESTPLLTSHLQPIFLYADNTTLTYDGSTVTSTTATVYDGTATGADYSGTASAAPTATAMNAGTYTLQANDLILTSPTDQLGYRFVKSDGVLTINPKAIDLSVSKTYDGTATFSSGFVLDAADIVGGDSVTVSGGTATVSSPNAATYNSFASSTLSLSNSNYTLTGGAVDAVINPSIVTLDVSVAKIYDGTVTFNTGFNLSDILGGDTVNISGSATVSSANAGTYTSFASSSLLLGGADSGNYTLTGGAVSAVINPKAVDISVSRTYNGAASFTGGFMLDSNDFIGGDSVTVNGGSATVSSANAGTYTSFATNSLTLSDSNYTLSGGAVNALINPKVIDLSVSRIYNGAASFASGFMLDSNDIIGSDSVAVSGGSATVSSANIGAFTSFASNSLSLSNSNYTLTGGTVNAEITAKPLGVTVSRVYDGSVNFNSGFSANTGDLVGNDTVAISGTATVSSANAGTYNSFVSSSLILSNGNYTLTGGSVNALINPKSIGLTVSRANNGTAIFNSGFQLNANDIVGSDTVSVSSGSATVSSAAEGNYSSFVTSTLSLSNGNYTLEGGSVRATITAASTPTRPQLQIQSKVNSVTSPNNNQGEQSGQNNQGTNLEQVTEQVTQPPPSQVSGRTTNPTPNPGEAIPITVPSLSQAPWTSFDLSQASAVMMPANGSADIPTPQPQLSLNANGSLSINVNVPPATPPGVYLVAVTVPGNNGAQSRAVIVPVVVRRARAA